MTSHRGQLTDKRYTYEDGGLSPDWTEHPALIILQPRADG